MVREKGFLTLLWIWVYDAIMKLSFWYSKYHFIIIVSVFTCKFFRFLTFNQSTIDKLCDNPLRICVLKYKIRGNSLRVLWAFVIFKNMFPRQSFKFFFMFTDTKWLAQLLKRTIEMIWSELCKMAKLPKML